MRKLSLWASDHPWTARVLIISLYIPLNLLGIITGDVLYDVGVIFPGSFILSLISIVLLLVFYYPSRNARSPGSSYGKQKAFDFLLAMCTFCMVCFTGNQKNVEHPFTLTTKVISVPVSTIQPSFPNSTFTEDPGKPKLSKKDSWKKKKTFFKQIRKKYKDLSDGEKILLVFLTIVVAIGLIALLAALACSIACAGSEALAYVVFFLGTGAITFLAVHLIHKILRKRKKPVNKDNIPAAPAS